MEHLGQAKAGVIVLPQGEEPTRIEDNVSLTYEIDQPFYGDAIITIELSPTLDTYALGGIRMGIAIDDRPAEILSFDLHATGGAQRTAEEKAWAKAVINNKQTLQWEVNDLDKGIHNLTVYRIDDNLVLEKLKIAFTRKSKPETQSAISRFFSELFGTE